MSDPNITNSAASGNPPDVPTPPPNSPPKQPENSDETNENGQDSSSQSKMSRGQILGLAGLSVYLLILLVLSANWLAGLMMVDTTKEIDMAACKSEAEKKAAEEKCKQDPKNCKPDPNSGNSNANTNANTNTNTNATRNANANTSTSANVNANVNANTEVNGNVNGGTVTSPPAGKPADTQNANTPDPSNKNAGGGAPSGNTNANTPAGEQVDELHLPKAVRVEPSGLLWSAVTVKSLTGDGCLTADGYLFLVVLFAGVVGSVIRAISALYWHVGKKTFDFSWVWFYLFQPFFGAGLGLVFYLVLRGGFGSGTVGKGNVFAYAAVGALAGLFSENALEKLRMVAESLLAPNPANKDKKTEGAGGSASASNSANTATPGKKED